MLCIRFTLPVLVAGLSLAAPAIAKDFELDELPEFKSENSFEMSASCEGGTYYDFMQNTLGPKMIELAPTAGRLPNEAALRKGKGVAVKLNDSNYNVHINFPHSAQGGRSYGWTDGKVGDWSDKMYLDNLAQVVDHGGRENLAAFYKVIIGMLGKCSVTGLSKLDDLSQRVATNFLAIYTAEQYRAIVGTPNWDDALLQTTLIAAFHGGQSELAKFYDGEFSGRAISQEACVYRKRHGRVRAREALLNDYWQFGRTAEVDPETGRCKGRSGINITRRDFEAMGEALTRYESAKKNSNLAEIRSLVGGGKNVFSSISRYFVKGAATPEKTTRLASAVSKFALDIYDHANDITEWELAGEKLEE